MFPLLLVLRMQAVRCLPRGGTERCAFRKCTSAWTGVLLQLSPSLHHVRQPAPGEVSAHQTRILLGRIHNLLSCNITFSSLIIYVGKLSSISGPLRQAEIRQFLCIWTPLHLFEACHRCYHSVLSECVPCSSLQHITYITHLKPRRLKCVLLFWVLTTCIRIGDYRRFGWKYRFHFWYSAKT
jgi:hypothetical protein